MSTNQTQHYGLHLWAPEDKFVREEFNENSEKTDTALQTLAAGKAEQSALNALSSTVNSKGYIAAGSYTGNGAASRSINVGFPVKAVFVDNQEGRRGVNGIMGGLAVQGSPLSKLGNAIASVSGNGFTVYTRSETLGSLNSANGVYHYVAFG